MASKTPVDAEKAGDAKRKIAGVSIVSGSLHRAGLESVVSRSQRKFEVEKLPPDMLRVYCELEKKYTEEYALLFVFTMRTAIEMHRAWHMTLLTGKILQRIKDTFGLRMTWNLGVIRLIFRVDDGAYELHRKVSAAEDEGKRILASLATRYMAIGIMWCGNLVFI